MRLALSGGTPVVTESQSAWPRWPVRSATLASRFQQILDSDRWTVTGTSAADDSLEQQFAAQFARFNGVSYCVPTVNGTTAIRLILQALEIGNGDEVIVPGLTWIACATAVTDVGAVPVFADVDPSTACISSASIARAITGRTAAIMAVHLYCNVADLQSIQ